jgi:hypothetical protein
MVEELLSTGREVRNEAPRRKQRGILMENDSLIRHKRRGIIPVKIKRMNQILFIFRHKLSNLFIQLPFVHKIFLILSYDGLIR